MLRIRVALEIEQGIIVNKNWSGGSCANWASGLPEHEKCSQNRGNAATEEDLVERKFAASAPNERCG